jgi:hypothetical protein
MQLGGEDHIQYHSDRAMAELDLALRAGCERAARAHAALSSLHLDSMRRLRRREPDLPAR